MEKKGFDQNELAAWIAAQVTLGVANPNKNPAAMQLGRLGGLKGGKARARKLSPERRKEIARKAALTRWNRGEV